MMGPVFVTFLTLLREARTIRFLFETMASRIGITETYHFRIGSERLTLYKAVGESYEHVLMKALGYAIFLPEYPTLKVEQRIGGRYKPDLVAFGEHQRIEFWGECGHVGLRKVQWLARHSGARRIVLFKFAIVPRPFLEQMRKEIEPRYRPANRISLINFAKSVLEEARERLDEVPADWYEQHEI